MTSRVGEGDELGEVGQLLEQCPCEATRDWDLKWRGGGVGLGWGSRQFMQRNRRESGVYGTGSG